MPRMHNRVIRTLVTASMLVGFLASPAGAVGKTLWAVQGTKARVTENWKIPQGGWYLAYSAYCIAGGWGVEIFKGKTVDMLDQAQGVPGIINLAREAGTKHFVDSGTFHLYIFELAHSNCHWSVQVGLG